MDILNDVNAAIKDILRTQFDNVSGGRVLPIADPYAQHPTADNLPIVIVSINRTYAEGEVGADSTHNPMRRAEIQIDYVDVAQADDDDNSIDEQLDINLDNAMYTIWNLIEYYKKFRTEDSGKPSAGLNGLARMDMSHTLKRTSADRSTPIGMISVILDIHYEQPVTVAPTDPFEKPQIIVDTNTE